MRRWASVLGLACACGPSTPAQTAADDGSTGGDPSPSTSGTSATSADAGDVSLTADDASTGDDDAETSAGESTTGEPRETCALGSSPGGELMWERADDPLGDIAGLAATRDGGFVVVSTVDDDRGLGGNVLVVKYDGSGRPQWGDAYDGVAALGDRALAVVADESDNIHVALTENVSEIWGRDFVATDQRVVLLRYSPDGEKLWRYEWPQDPIEPLATRWFAGSLGLVTDVTPVLVAWEPYVDDHAIARQFDARGNVIAETTLEPFSTEDVDIVDVTPTDHFLTGAQLSAGAGEFQRFDPSGRILWTVATSGGTVVEGSEDDTSFAIVNVSTAGSTFARIQRRDAAGRQLWEIEIDPSDTGNASWRSASATCDGGIVLAGQLSNNLTSEAWVARVESDGSERWQARHDFGRPDGYGWGEHSVALVDGDVVAAGQFWSDDGSMLRGWLGRFRGGE